MTLLLPMGLYEGRNHIEKQKYYSESTPPSGAWTWGSPVGSQRNAAGNMVIPAHLDSLFVLCAVSRWRVLHGIFWRRTRSLSGGILLRVLLLWLAGAQVLLWWPQTAVLRQSRCHHTVSGRQRVVQRVSRVILTLRALMSTKVRLVCVD